MQSEVIAINAEDSPCCAQRHPPSTYSGFGAVGALATAGYRRSAAPNPRLMGKFQQAFPKFLERVSMWIERGGCQQNKQCRMS